LTTGGLENFYHSGQLHGGIYITSVNEFNLGVFFGYGYKFAAGSNNISYNSINKKATFSFNFNQYYNESYYYIIPLFVNPYGGGDAAYVLSGVLGFCKDTYSLNTVYSLGGRSIRCCVVGIVGDVQYIFYVPTFFDGYVFRQYFGVGF
jgi:hypothetical protein